MCSPQQKVGTFSGVCFEKIFFHAKWALLGTVLLGLFFIALRNNPSTVSFRGTVVEINNTNEENVYIKALMIFGTVPRTIRVDGNVSIRNLISGEKMSIDEINIGDMIDLDVRGRWDDVTAIIIPRWIRVLPKQ